MLYLQSASMEEKTGISSCIQCYDGAITFVSHWRIKHAMWQG